MCVCVCVCARARACVALSASLRDLCCHVHAPSISLSLEHSLPLACSGHGWKNAQGCGVWGLGIRVQGLHAAVIHITSRTPPICARAYPRSAACSRKCSLSSVYPHGHRTPHLHRTTTKKTGVVTTWNSHTVPSKLRMAQSAPAVARKAPKGARWRVAPLGRVPRATLAMWGLVMIASVVVTAGAGAFLVAAPGLDSWCCVRARAALRASRLRGACMNSCTHARTHARVPVYKLYTERNAYTHVRARKQTQKPAHKARAAHARSPLHHPSLSGRNNARGRMRG